MNLRICQNVYTFVFSCYKVIVFTFMIQEQLITSSFCKNLGWSILIHLFAKFIMGDILADTAILSKKEPLCSCYEHTSRVCLQLNEMAAVWALSARKICQHAIILERQSWALDCFFHCDVFSTIN